MSPSTTQDSPTAGLAAAEDLAGAPAEKPGFVRRTLQRVVFPANRDTDVMPLYVDAEKAQLFDLTTNVGGQAAAIASAISRMGTSGSEGAFDPQQILGRRSVRVCEGTRLSFGTYFNAFAASYWRKWTVVDQVRLTGRVEGRGASVIVYRSMPDGRSQRAKAIEGIDTDAVDFSFDLTLQPFGDGGWYWFDVVAGTEDATLIEAEWSAAVPEGRAEAGTITIGITTMNRPEFCANLLTEIGAEPHVLDLLDEVIVVDQGTKKVSDADLFPDAQEAIGDKLRVIEQGNIGGSGGFARSQAEVLEADRSTYVLFYDDDIESEPEGIVRVGTFADLCRRPTIVGGHMFSLYSKARLHSFGEIINPWRFWWQSPPTVETDWDFASRNLRSSRWLHRRIDVDFTPWFMCLIPLSVIKEIGLSLPVFIKWDDSEYGVRASAAGYPTVTMPGAAVWHVPWTDKNDALDWQAYYHQRNRFVAALLHSPYDRGGRMVRESFNHQVKHLFSMQYSTAELRHKALEDVLKGPGHLHPSIGTTLPEIRAMRSEFQDGQSESDPDAFPQVRRKKPPKRGVDPTAPKGVVGQMVTAATSTVRQFRPRRELANDYPEASLAAMDAKWWKIAQFDSVIVSTPDGTSAMWYQRDKAEFQSLLSRTVAIHERFLREWPRLAKEYQKALPDITSVEAWRKTFADTMPDQPDQPSGSDEASRG